MKRVLLSLVPILCCLAVCMSAPAFADTPAASSSVHSVDRERVQRIENGLLPAIVVNGQQNRGMNLAERMRHHKVPGVSIAFFSGGKILWTRVYGYADVAKMTPATSETLFQAASISKPISTLAMLRWFRMGN
jgi:CubicO group peptidase (beta-lactamase class C family)